MKVDFSSYLDLNAPPKKDVVKIDQSKYKKKKTGGVTFDSAIGAYGELSSLTTIQTVETYFNPNDYIINCDDDVVLCAALYGSPLY